MVRDRVQAEAKSIITWIDNILQNEPNDLGMMSNQTWFSHDYKINMNFSNCSTKLALATMRF